MKWRAYIRESVSASILRDALRHRGRTGAWKRGKESQHTNAGLRDSARAAGATAGRSFVVHKAHFI